MPDNPWLLLVMASLTAARLTRTPAEHRRAMGTNRVERWLKKHGYPEGFRILCANCNWARHLNGGICPHAETVGRLLRVA